MKNFSKYSKYYFLGTLSLITFFVWYAVYAESRDGLMVSFLDVGQGDAIFIEAPNGNQVLLDAGPNKAVLRELSKIMPFYDRTIDVVIESHPDADHIGGLPEILKRYEIGAVLESGVLSDSAVYKTIGSIIKEKNIKNIMARSETRINLGEGAYIDILFPDRDVDGLETNAASVVTRLVYGETEFLFAGDSPKGMENYLTSIYGKNLESDVLKISHHGSNTSTGEQFLGHVNPKYAIISAGKENRYGHPHKEIINRLEQFGISVLRTDESGTIKIKSNGEDIIVK